MIDTDTDYFDRPTYTDPFDPMAIAMSLSPRDQQALKWAPANGAYQERFPAHMPDGCSVWQLCHWRVMDGTLAPLLEAREDNSDFDRSVGFFRATELGLKVRALLVQPGMTAFSYQPNRKPKKRNRVRKS